MREQVLVKEKKLYGSDIEAIRGRFAFLKRTASARIRAPARGVAASQRTRGYDALVKELEGHLREHEAEMDRMLSARDRGQRADDVRVRRPVPSCAGLAKRTFRDIDGVERPLLTDEEVRFLTIRGGISTSRSVERSSLTSRTRSASSNRFPGRASCGISRASPTRTTRS